MTTKQEALEAVGRLKEILLMSTDGEDTDHDIILDFINSVPEWQCINSVNPEVEQRGILGHKYSVVTGYWDGKIWINERSRLGSQFPATHFMPLPQPPKETQ